MALKFKPSLKRWYIYVIPGSMLVFGSLFAVSILFADYFTIP